MRDRTKEDLLAQARELGVPEAEALQAWEEMKRKHRLPWYVEPELEARDGAVTLSPAVTISLLSRVEREVPGWAAIRGPVWSGNAGKAKEAKHSPDDLTPKARTLRTEATEKVATAVPNDIRYPLRHHPLEELEFFPDTAEQCSASVDGTGLRPQLEKTFQEAIERARGLG